MTQAPGILGIACLLLVGLNVLFYGATWIALSLSRRVRSGMTLKSRERLLLTAIFLPPLFSLFLTAYSVWSAITCDDVTREVFLIGPCTHLARHLCLHLDSARLAVAAALQLGELSCAGLLTAILVLAFWLRARQRGHWSFVAPSNKLQQIAARARRCMSAPGVRILQANDCPMGAALLGWRTARCVVASWLVHLSSPLELEVALRHELAHARRRDNLTRTLMRVCRILSLSFPAAQALCAEWEQVAELQCDEEAVHDREEALALASVMVSVLRRGAVGAVRPVPAAFALMAPDDASALTRIERLVRYPVHPPQPGDRGAGPLGLALGLLLSGLSLLLSATLHCIVETLIRLPLMF